MTDTVSEQVAVAEHLTYRDAARRVRRSVRTIKRWRRGGMPMTFDAQGRRVVELSTLLRWWRARMTADPVHQARLRAQSRVSP
jgi:hypothetical protein